MELQVQWVQQDIFQVVVMEVQMFLNQEHERELLVEEEQQHQNQYPLLQDKQILVVVQEVGRQEQLQVVQE